MNTNKHTNSFSNSAVDPDNSNSNEAVESTRAENNTPEPAGYRKNISRRDSQCVHDSAGSYAVSKIPTSPIADRTLADDTPEDNNRPDGLSKAQQQFVLRFCRQLASVIEACEQSETAEIEVGRRHIDSRLVKVKLQAEREFSHQLAKPARN